MSDDIVTRLRDYLAIVDHAFVWNELSDAADEIERLRTELADWQRTVRALEAQLSSYIGTDGRSVSNG